MDFKGANLCYQFEVFMFPNDDKVNDKRWKDLEISEILFQGIFPLDLFL